MVCGVGEVVVAVFALAVAVAFGVATFPVVELRLLVLLDDSAMMSR